MPVLCLEIRALHKFSCVPACVVGCMGIVVFWSDNGLLPSRDKMMKGRTCITSNFVIFSCLGLGAINTGAIASEINHPAFNYSAQEIQRLLPV